jgi:hypothetical protein
MKLFTDQELVAHVRALANKWKVSEATLLSCAEQQVEVLTKAHFDGNLIPKMILEEEYKIDKESSQDWPDWAKEIVPEGSIFEKIRNSDGSLVLRLVTKRAKLIALQFRDK